MKETWKERRTSAKPVAAGASVRNPCSRHGRRIGVEEGVDEVGAVVDEGPTFTEGRLCRTSTSPPDRKTLNK